MADRAGLEPATSALTERRSDRLNYLPKKEIFSQTALANRKSEIAKGRQTRRKNRFSRRKTNVFVANKRREFSAFLRPGKLSRPRLFRKDR
jgi:hypothetical protein